MVFKTATLATDWGQTHTRSETTHDHADQGVATNSAADTAVRYTVIFTVTYIARYLPLLTVVNSESTDFVIGCNDVISIMD